MEACFALVCLRPPGIIYGLDCRSELLFGIFIARSPDLSMYSRCRSWLFFPLSLRWQVEAHPRHIDHFFNDEWHGSVAPRALLVDAGAGADGFWGCDIDRGRWRGHPLRWPCSHLLSWTIGNYLGELLYDLFVL